MATVRDFLLDMSERDAEGDNNYSVASNNYTRKKRDAELRAPCEPSQPKLLRKK